jgi:hypothetical protein
MFETSSEPPKKRRDMSAREPEIQARALVTDAQERLGAWNEEVAHLRAVLNRTVSDEERSATLVRCAELAATIRQADRAFETYVPDNLKRHGRIEDVRHAFKSILAALEQIELKLERR